MQGRQTGEVVIRECSLEELPVLHAIDRLCFPPLIAYTQKEIRFFLRGPRAIGLAAERDGVVIGFAVGRTGPERRAHVITLDVLPGERRHGTGMALMESLHREFRLRGATSALLEVDTGNEPALRFYHRLGYEIRKLLPGYYPEGRSAYRMSLDL